jgi:hypothetical protein
MFGRFSRNDSGGRDGASTTLEINFGYAVAGWEKRVVGQRVDEDEDLQQRQDDQCEGPPCLKRRPQGVAFRNETLSARSPRRSASRSRSSAIRSRAAQMVALPARSANSRYHLASSRSFRRPASRCDRCLAFGSPTRALVTRVAGSDLLHRLVCRPRFPYRSQHGAIADVPTTARRLPRPFLILNPRPP